MDVYFKTLSTASALVTWGKGALGSLYRVSAVPSVVTPETPELAAPPYPVWRVFSSWLPWEVEECCGFNSIESKYLGLHSKHLGWLTTLPSLSLSSHWPWANNSILLNPSFAIYKIGIWYQFLMTLWGLSVTVVWKAPSTVPGICWPLLLCLSLRTAAELRVCVSRQLIIKLE